jgi:molecular chaperone DnaK
MPKVYPGVSFEELESRRKDKLMNEVERMKIEFSEYDDYTMTLGEGSKPVDIDYDMFSDIITPLITENVLNSILKIMEKANVSPENIDAVILAGGSSGLRPFADIILSLFGEDKIIFDDELERLWDDAIAIAGGSLDYTKNFFIDEWIKVVQAQEAYSKEKYVKASRILS